jgi:hypothetical protein
VHCVHETSNRTVAHLLRSALEAEGVAAIVQGEHLTPLQGGSTPAGASAAYRVCLVDPEQLPKATRFVREWLEQRARRSTERWVCPVCGEEHEASFESCWQCGSEPDSVRS